MAVYELHIICVGADPKRIAYFAENDTAFWNSLRAIRPRLTHVINRYGDYPSQPMLTTCVRADSNAEAVSMGLAIKTQMQHSGIVGEYRVKVELQTASKMPDTVGVELTATGAPQYYELHWDIACSGHDLGAAGQYTPHYLELEKVAAEHGVHLFFNCAKPVEKQLPVATARFFNCSREHAREQQRVISQQLGEQGWVQRGSAEFEHSCYDDNIKFDNGWLHNGDPTNIYRAVPVA